MYEIQLFGRLEVRTRGVRLAGGDLGGARHLLALLALRGKLHRDELADLLSDGRPAGDGPATVEGQVSLLRRRLDPYGHRGDSVITTSNGGYALVADQVRVDVARFDELVAAAAGRTADQALRPLTAAAHLATRPLLEDAGPAPWVVRAREQYRDRLVATLLDAAAHALTTGDRPGALAQAGRAVALDPASERAQAIVRAARAEVAALAA